MKITNSKRSTSSNGLGLRKGAWTAEEDFLLRKCIEKYGEGKWHKVPLNAGLNRCRKSCRLRWLNYLRPDIKRGVFAEDEQDLIIRLHKLLGNRWSLIAGRLPGRTANDVKNYWNSHLQKKIVRPREDKKIDKITKATIIKPRPRTFTRNNLPQRERNTTFDNSHQLETNTIQPFPTSLSFANPVDDNNLEWWTNIFDPRQNNEEEEEENGPFSLNFTHDLLNPTNGIEEFDVNGLWS